MEFHVDDEFATINHLDWLSAFIVAPGQMKGENKREFYHRIKRALLVGAYTFDQELIDLGLLPPDSRKQLNKQRYNCEFKKFLKACKRNTPRGH